MLCYEAAPAFDSALKTRTSGPLPLAWAAVFEAPAHHRANLAKSNYQLGPWTPLCSRSDFGEPRVYPRVIAAGDTYQVNYTFPLTATFAGDSYSWYLDLCAAQGATYCAYFDLGRFKVLSLSPELFFEHGGRNIQTRPMKGTIKRGRWPGEDKAQADQLKESAKDRAENVMIVDLLRNDLGRVAVSGSVKASKLFEIERYETLWQMTSTVEATLRDDVGLMELMRGLFPCGSSPRAQGATCRSLGELEPVPRAYTGTLVSAAGGDAIFKLAIHGVIFGRCEATSIWRRDNYDRQPSANTKSV